MKAFTSSLTLQNAATGTGTGTVMDIAGLAVVAIALTISDSATVTFEASLGGTMTALPARNIATGASATTATATGIYVVNVAGLTRFQCRVSTFGAGTITAYAIASSTPGGSEAGSAASGGTSTTIAAPLGRQADAASVSTALSTEDVALITSRFPTGATLADGAAVPSATLIGVTPQFYNGATLDFQRANLEGTALASAARTATTNSADITNHNSLGVLVFLNVTVASGTGGLQVRVTGKDPVSGNYSFLNGTPTAVTAVSNNVPPTYLFYPGVNTTAVGSVAQATSSILPRTFRITVSHGDATSYTYSVGYALIN